MLSVCDTTVCTLFRFEAARKIGDYSTFLSELVKLREFLIKAQVPKLSQVSRWKGFSKMHKVQLSWACRMPQIQAF